MSDNPLAGLSVPSVAELVEYVMTTIGTATIDLSNQVQRDKLRLLLSVSLERTIQFGLQEALEKATGKAVSHVLALMRDPAYQKARKARRKETLKRNRERISERAKQTEIDRNAMILKRIAEKHKGVMQ
jgi:hypothetical protein